MGCGSSQEDAYSNKHKVSFMLRLFLYRLSANTLLMNVTMNETQTQLLYRIYHEKKGTGVQFDKGLEKIRETRAEDSAHGEGQPVGKDPDQE